MTELDFYRQHSVFSDPGEFAALWDTVPPTISDMKAAITPLLFHYRGDGNWDENGIEPERIGEVNLRYAADMLGCVNALKPIMAGEIRLPKERMVGCCRDWALLLVSLARHHGFAARSRVGFSNYFMEEWWIDHTVTEIWDETEQRWRLVDAELHVPWQLSSGQQVIPLDISHDIFLPGLDAWREIRAGKRDSATFVVHPDLHEAGLRGLPFVWHNTVMDLAALNSFDMLPWDGWGIDLDGVTEEGAALLDRVGASESLEERQQFFAMDAFRVPEKVLSFQPDEETPTEVKIRTA